MIVPPDFEGIAGVLIDAVGTLIEPAPPVAMVYAEVARLQGIELDLEIVRARFRRSFAADESDELRGPLATDEAIERRRWRRIVSEVLPELPDSERGFERLWDHFGRPESWRCFADVGPAMEALRTAGLAVRIASNFDARLREVARGLPDLVPWAGAIVISSEVGYRKPHPAFFEAACARLGLPAAKVVCVGDDPENDVIGARRAGLRAILVDRGRGSTADPADLGAAVSAILGRPGSSTFRAGSAAVG